MDNLEVDHMPGSSNRSSGMITGPMLAILVLVLHSNPERGGARYSRYDVAATTTRFLTAGEGDAKDGGSPGARTLPPATVRINVAEGVGFEPTKP